MPVDEATFYTPVCDNNCGWFGNPTPSQAHAKESLDHHMAEHAKGAIPETQLDELGNAN